MFAAFEMMATAVLMGPQAVFMPLRMIGAMVLGAEALDPGYSLITAAVAGVIVHMVLSIAFALMLAAVTPAAITPGTLALIGIAFGIGLWLVNFYVIAPFAGWTWFPERTNPIVQFLAHAFLFGLPVALMTQSHDGVSDRSASTLGHRLSLLRGSGARRLPGALA